MEFKISKKQFYTTIGIVMIAFASAVAWGFYHAPVSPRPYAGVKGEDLPAVVGEPSLSITKIPYTETVNYKEYTPEVLASARKSGNAILLYYYANWCTSCREQETIHAAFFDNALKSHLPLIGIRVNIDDKPPVMREYEMNYSHGYALLDRSGKVVSKFFGTHSEAELMAEVKKAL